MYEGAIHEALKYGKLLCLCAIFTAFGIRRPVLNKEYAQLTVRTWETVLKAEHQVTVVQPHILFIID